MPNSDSLLFTARGLTKRHGTRTALVDADFEIHRGEVIGLVGENGAGKSTLMSLLGGAYPATRGTMLLDGEPYAPDSREAALAAGVSAIPQRLDLDPEAIVADALFSTSYLSTLPAEEKLARARAALEADGLTVEAESRIGDLAHAEQVYVSLLRLTFEETHLVLLDEIAATANDLEISVLHAITNRLTAQGRAVVYVSHRLDEIQTLSDRIFVMRAGRLARIVTPEMTRDRSGIAYFMFDREIAPAERPGDPGAVDGTDALLELEGVCADGVDDVTLALRPGEVLGITGLRRSGHSELAGTIGGARPITAGTMRLRGQELRPHSIDNAIESGIAYLSDVDSELGIDSHDTLVTASAAKLGGAAGFAAEAAHFRRIIGTLKELSISTSGLHEPVGHLSGGDHQKVALAKWLRSGAQVVVLNHPTRGVDAASREAVYGMVEEVTARGGGVLLVSSDMTELVEQCHRIAVMRGGRLVDLLGNAEVTEDTLVMRAMGDDWAPSSRAGRRAVLA